MNKQTMALDRVMAQRKKARAERDALKVEVARLTKQLPEGATHATEFYAVAYYDEGAAGIVIEDLYKNRLDADKRVQMLEALCSQRDREEHGACVLTIDTSKAK